MKQLQTFRSMLQTLKLFAEMPAGQGWVTPHTLRNWSGVSHSTTYRNLPKLEKNGLVKTRKTPCGNKENCYEYSISDKGYDWLSSYQELGGLFG